MKARWYLARLSRMGTAEIAWRARNAALQLFWRRRAGVAWPTPVARPCWAGAATAPLDVPTTETERLTQAAEAVLAGSWSVFGRPVAMPPAGLDWFRDPATGRTAPADVYCFSVPFRDEVRIGNVKTVWELSRLQHVTLLASAYAATGRVRFAERAVADLNSWFVANPPLCGVNWVSGIELGLRLIAFVWVRRLLASWPGAPYAFEESRAFQTQLHAHQSWIATFQSRNTSANNHLIAELTGLLVAATCFPLFRESADWALQARARLEAQAELQCFADGVHRELASGYHVFVLELLLLAGVEADAAGTPLAPAFWDCLRRMADVLAASVDCRLQPARQGDGDDGRALLLAPPDQASATDVLAIAAHIFGPAPWWPTLPDPGVASLLVGALANPRRGTDHLPRPAQAPSWYPDAGILILRDRAGAGLWCRVDAGPHGFLATAAHAHADALGFELRIGAQEILVDPGTYCYHGEAEWRNYFRSTLAHNTLELGGRDQGVHAGPFLWVTRPTTRVTCVVDPENPGLAGIDAWHDGYVRQLRAGHRRRFTLKRRCGMLEICDRVEADAAQTARLAFHVHPAVTVSLRACDAVLSWDDGGVARTIMLRLPDGLHWSVRRGETRPIIGWYSPSFGRKEPCSVLLGTGQMTPGRIYATEICYGGAVADRRVA